MRDETEVAGGVDWGEGRQATGHTRESLGLEGCYNCDCDRVQSKDGDRVLGSPSLENLEAGIFFQKMDKG